MSLASPSQHYVSTAYVLFYFPQQSPQLMTGTGAMRPFRVGAMLSLGALHSDTSKKLRIKVGLNITETAT